MRPGELVVLQAPPQRARGSRTLLLKEEKGSRRSSYWEEYRSSVSSLPPLCMRTRDPVTEGPTGVRQ